MIQRSAPGWSACSSHLPMAQNAEEMNSGDTPKTMPSTALNQNESEKVNASAPTAPAPMMAIAFSLVTGSPFFTSSFFANRVVVQNRKRTAKPLLNEESR